MPEKIEKLPAIDEELSAQAASHFAWIEEYANRDPNGFSFFINKYKHLMYEDPPFDWGAHLFPPEQLEQGILMKWLPLIGTILVLLINIFILFKIK